MLFDSTISCNSTTFAFCILICILVCSCMYTARACMCVSILRWHAPNAPVQLSMCSTIHISVAADCWVGCDVALPLKLRVIEQTKAQKEERIAKAQAAASAQEPPAVSDDDADAPTAAGDEGDDEDGEVSGEGECRMCAFAVDKLRWMQ